MKTVSLASFFLKWTLTYAKWLLTYTKTNIFIYLYHTNYNSWRRQWHPTPVLLPGKSHGWRSLVGCSPWGSQRVRHDWATSLSLFTFMHWRRKWQPTPVFLPGEIPGTGKPGGLLSMGLHRVGHDWSNLACMHTLEKEMAAHSSVLAWRIPETEEPGGLPSMGLHRVGCDWRDLAAATCCICYLSLESYNASLL